MNANDALEIAQRAYPHDRVARLAYMNVRWDTCDPENMLAWAEAIERELKNIAQLDRESFLYGTQGVN